MGKENIKTSNKRAILPYYKIDKTEEGKKFFFSRTGYFNFWNEYLIANIKVDNSNMFFMLSNRTGRKLINKNSGLTKTQELSIYNTLLHSVCLKKPKEMFEDFPELELTILNMCPSIIKVYRRFYG